jgi:DNA repair exonuclease SbcCD ATPase subunit
MEFNAEAEKRITVIQDKARDTIQEARNEISRKEADMLKEKNRADQLKWALEHEREACESVKQSLEKLKSEHSKRQEALVLRVATLEQNLFESRDETAREKEKRVSMESKVSRLIVRAEQAEKLSEELREAEKKNREKYKELMEKERQRHAQSVAMKEITSGLEKDLRAAAASGAAIAALQAEVERASQRAELYVMCVCISNHLLYTNVFTQTHRAAKKAESCFQDIRRVDSPPGVKNNRTSSPPGILRPSKPVPSKPETAQQQQQQQKLKDAVLRRNTDMLMNDFGISPSVLNDADTLPTP